MTGFWRGVADRMRLRRARGHGSAVLTPTRIENEIAQLQSIRDDAQRVTPGSALHQWINGAIFALVWISGERGSQSPSWAAAWMRSGQKLEGPP